METTIVRVKIADYHVLKSTGILITIGLGSCIGIALYDNKVKVAGLGHILLADSTNFQKTDNLAKFADTAVPLLLKEMKKAGADISRVKAKIVGGSELFNYKKGVVTVGAKNIAAVKKALAKAGIPLLAEDVGGSSGRTMELHADTGQVIVKTVGQTQKEL